MLRDGVPPVDRRKGTTEGKKVMMCSVSGALVPLEVTPRLQLLARRLSPQQAAFVEEYLVTLDPARAAEAVGISKRRANWFLKHPYVAEAIEIVMRRYSRRLRSSAEPARPSLVTGARDGAGGRSRRKQLRPNGEPIPRYTKDAAKKNPTETQPASRAVVSDDGREIQLTFYSGETGAVAAASIDPVRAIAERLIRAALQRLSS
jgi:hypothetical protein